MYFQLVSSFIDIAFSTCFILQTDQHNLQFIRKFQNLLNSNYTLLLRN